MLLLIDVGNTNICVTRYANKKLDDKIVRVDTKAFLFNNKILFEALNEAYDINLIEDVAISSVVPDVTKLIKDGIKQDFNINPYVLISNKQSIIKVICDEPDTVGADLVSDTAGINGTGLIIDFGTATKYIYVHDNTMDGVSITPGVEVSLKALTNSAALLDETEIEVPTKILGYNTADCIRSGVTHAIAAQADGMIRRIKEETNNKNLNVYITGGLAPLIGKLCEEPVILDELITLKGLLRIYLEDK